MLSVNRLYRSLFWLILGLMIMPLLICGCGTNSSKAEPAHYDPDLDSIKQHKLPEWYDDAKLGIFIHWGIYSVPAYAPTTRPPQFGFMDVMKGLFSDKPMTENPYAAWYLNSLRIKGSPVYEYHISKYGENYDYYKFAEEFNKEAEKWNPDEWAQLFSEIGAKYVVITTKHHDGFTLWQSKTKHPYIKPEYQASQRDIVGELTQAVRAKGMRMGLYYSGGFDWGFSKEPIKNFRELNGPASEEYARFADAHWRELIELYKPSVLWNDISYPQDGDLMGIIADYYNKVPDGVIDNRWLRKSDVNRSLFTLGILKPKIFYDFDTPEYAKKFKVKKKKWEATRGIGWCFAYNANEKTESYLSAEELIHLFIDIVSKNGNLLLDVGPKPDGTILDIQVSRLKALGSWLDVNGEAIFATRPYKKGEGKTVEGIEFRYTRKDKTLYVILLSKPDEYVTLKSIKCSENSSVSILGIDQNLEWSKQGKKIRVKIPDDLPESHAYTIKITDVIMEK